MATAGGFGEAFAAIEREHGVDLKDEAHRWRVRDQIAAVVKPWAASLTLTEVTEKLTKAGALWGPYKMPRELIAGDPLVTKNPPITREQLDMVALDNVTPPDAVEQRFGFSPAPIRSKLGYLTAKA